MKNLILISLINIFLFTSCKSDLEKIELNNIEAHRAYQDSILIKYMMSGDVYNFYKKSDSIISLYKSLKNEEKEKNANYFYYIGRLYLNVNNQKFSNFYDTSNNIFIDQRKYREYYDSGYYYIQKSLSLDPNHIKAIYNLVHSIYIENNRFIDSKDTTFSQEKNSSRIYYIIDNISKFMNNNSYDEKKVIDNMTEQTLLILTEIYFKHNFKYNFTFIKDDINRSLVLDVLGNVVQRVYNINKLEFINKEYFVRDTAKINSNVILARNDIERRNKIAAEKERLAKLEVNRVERILQICGPYLDKIFDCQWRSARRYLRLNSDGTFELGYWEEVEDVNGNYNKRFFYDQKGKFEVVDAKNIKLINYFSSTNTIGNGSSSPDVTFYMDEFTLFGIKSLILNGRMVNGMLSHDEELKFDACANCK